MSVLFDIEEYRESVRGEECPKCDAAEDHKCVDDQGNRVETVHDERCMAHYNAMLKAEGWA